MLNEIAVMKQLQEVIIDHLNDYITNAAESIDDKSVVVDFPSTDTMPKKNMIYIQPNFAEYEPSTTNSDESSFDIAVFIVCKRDKSENLVEKVFDYYNGLYKLFKEHETLENTVDFVVMQSMNYYPQVEMNKNVVGIECSVVVRYTKDF